MRFVGVDLAWGGRNPSGLVALDRTGRVVAEGTPAQIRRSHEPFVNQFVNGSAEGPVPFHYPAPDYTADLEVAAPVRGQEQDPCEPSRPQVPARLAERQVHGGGQRGPHLRLHDSQCVGRHLRLVDTDREPDGLALKTCECPDDRDRRGVAVKVGRIVP